MPTYLTSAWKRATDTSIPREDGFARHLREIARPIQIAFAKLMKLTSGLPMGCEMRQTDGSDRWAVVLPEPVPAGARPMHRLLSFDNHGFTGHEQYNTEQEAIETMLGRGFTAPDPGALQRIIDTATWVRGMQIQSLFDKVCRGELNWNEYQQQAALCVEDGGVGLALTPYECPDVASPVASNVMAFPGKNANAVVELKAHLVVHKAGSPARIATDAEILLAAEKILAARMRDAESLTNPDALRSFLRVRQGPLEHEVFAVVHLDAQHRLIEYEELFRGTIASTAVYPREVVKSVLARNSYAVALAHNHPSGYAEPSAADRILTDNLKRALALIDVRVLDHLVVTPTEVKSFAEMGLI